MLHVGVVRVLGLSVMDIAGRDPATVLRETAQGGGAPGEARLPAASRRVSGGLRLSGR